VNVISKLMTGAALVASASSYAQGSYGDCCPPAPCGTPTECCDNGFSVHADYLLWQMQEDGLQYAETFNVFADATAPNGISARVPGFIYEPDAEWNSGFRIGAGYKVPCTCWDLAADWTWYRNDSSSSTCASEVNVVPTATILWLADEASLIAVGTETATSLPSRAKQKHELQYDVLDLTAGAKFCPCNGLEFRPFIGLRGAVIDQTQHVKYTHTLGPITVRKTNNFWGVGPRVGIDTNWAVGCGFSVISRAGTSLLCGQADCDYHAAIKTSTPQVDVQPDHEGNVVDFPAENPFNVAESIKPRSEDRVRPCADLMLGLSWETCYCQNTYVRVSLGYEVQYWWNQWMAPTSDFATTVNTSRVPGDLVLHGLDLSVGVSF